MTSLLDDFHGLELGKSAPKIPQSRKEKLQAELRILEWHKMSNAAAIKSALLQTKTLKTTVPQRQPVHTQEDEKWIKRVIQQEHIKPLEVNRDFVIDYEARETENAERLSHQVERHISTLKSLRQRLEQRHDLRQRQNEYREWNRDFQPKKQAVLIGKTLSEYEEQRQRERNRDRSETDREREEREDGEIQEELLQRAMKKKKEGGKGHQSSQELNTVLDSLSRLADLEQRISSLEKENAYDSLVQRESLPAYQRSSVEFSDKIYPTLSHTSVNGNVVNNNTNSNSINRQRAEVRKRRTETGERGGGPVGVKYEVRQRQQQRGGGDPLFSGGAKQKSWQVQVPVGSGINVARASHRISEEDEDENEYDTDDYDNRDNNRERKKPGIFLTAGQSTDDLSLHNRDRENRDRDRELKQKERLRNLHLAPQGVKVLRSRLNEKSERQREKALGQERHKAALEEMQRRKRLERERGRGKERETKMGVSAAAKNAQRQRERQTQQQRGGVAVVRGAGGKNKHMQQFEREKRMHERRKDEILHKAPVRRAPHNNNNINNKDSAVAARLVSQTAPVYRKPVIAQRGGAGGRGGGEGMTRKAEKLPVSSRSANPTPGPFAVQGIGGLRVIKAGAQR